MDGFKKTCKTRLKEGEVIIASLKKLNKDLEYQMKQSLETDNESLETDKEIIISKTLEGGAIPTNQRLINDYSLISTGGEYKYGTIMGCLNLMIKKIKIDTEKPNKDGTIINKDIINLIDLKNAKFPFLTMCNMTHKSPFGGTYVDNPAVPPFISIDRLRVSYDMFSKFITTPTTCEHLIFELTKVFSILDLYDFYVNMEGIKNLRFEFLELSDQKIISSTSEIKIIPKEFFKLLDLIPKLINIIENNNAATLIGTIHDNTKLATGTVNLGFKDMYKLFYPDIHTIKDALSYHFFNTKWCGSKKGKYY